MEELKTEPSSVIMTEAAMCCETFKFWIMCLGLSVTVGLGWAAEDESSWLDTVRGLQLGSSESVVSNAVANLLGEDTAALQQLYTRELTWLSGYKCVIVRVPCIDSRRRQYLIALFKEGLLRDLMSFVPRMSMKPLKPNGDYGAELAKFKIGDNIERLRSRLGYGDLTDYYRNKEGKWQTTISYDGGDAGVRVFEVDAATGRVVDAWTSKI